MSPAPPPSKAKVLFAWKGSKDNHLSLRKGALVTVYEQKDKWWSGELEGNVGWFPKTFVKIISEGEAGAATGGGGGEKSAGKSRETM